MGQEIPAEDDGGESKLAPRSVITSPRSQSPLTESDTATGHSEFIDLVYCENGREMLLNIAGRLNTHRT